MLTTLSPRSPMYSSDNIAGGYIGSQGTGMTGAVLLIRF